MSFKVIKVASEARRGGEFDLQHTSMKRSMWVLCFGAVEMGASWGLLLGQPSLLSKS